MAPMTTNESVQSDAEAGVKVKAMEYDAMPEELLERGWAALPESYRIPEVAPTLEEARDYCKQLVPL